MAVEFVKQATGSSGSVSATLTCTLASAPAAGNLLVFGMAGDKNTGALTLSGFTPVYALLSTSVSLYVSYKISDGTETSISPSWASVSASGNTAWYAEYTDPLNSAAWNVMAMASRITDETTVNTWTTGTANAALADGKGIAFFGVDSGQSLTSTTLTWGSSYSERYNSRVTVNSGAADVFVGEKVETQGVNASSSLTYTGTADQLSGAIILLTKSALAQSQPGRSGHPGRSPGQFGRSGRFTYPKGDTTVSVVVTADIAMGYGTAGSTDTRPGMLLALQSSGAPLSDVGTVTGLALGTGTAFDATVSTSSSGTTAVADLAAGTGTAFSPVVDVGTLPDIALGTGAALALLADTGAAPAVAQGTGTASAPVVDVGSAPALAAGTGTSFTDSAIDIVVTGTETASGSGTVLALLADTGAAPAVASGTGTALDASIALEILPATASGTGTASQPVPDVTVLPELAPGTGTAFDATVSTSGSTTVTADLASGTGTAFDAITDIGTLPATANGTGLSLAPVQDVGGLPGTALGSGAALDASAAVAVQGTGIASGTGTASDAVSDIGASPSVATGTGAALDSSVALVILSAGLATGTGAAFDAVGTGAASTVANADVASGTGVAFGALSLITALAEMSSGTGTAFDAAVVLPQSGTPIPVSGREPLSVLYGREPSASLRGQDPGPVSGREPLSSTSGTEPRTSVSGREPHE